MNTQPLNPISRNFQRLNHEFDEPINLPASWPSVWNAFGIWLFSNSQFGLNQFCASGHRALIADVVALASQPYSSVGQWSSLAVRTRRALKAALNDSSLDEECIQAACAVHAFVLAASNGNIRFAQVACQAAVVSRANGWAAYARGCSAAKIYLKVLQDSVAAQVAEFVLLTDALSVAQAKCAA